MADGGISSLAVGTVVNDRYRIRSVVGRGGLGTVYQVEDVIFGKGNVYALKELVDHSLGARKQFEMESQWLQSLNHNHIPKFREHFEWQACLYLVMDFVAGENLEQKLARLGGRGLSEQQAITWILPICDALHYLHTRIPPILHRDLKPANIIVTPAGHPVLVDLGIAKEHLPGANLTATFVRKAGTEGYAPPEQYTTAGQTGPWSDVYGIGATLYHLLTGCVPPTAVDRVALDARLIHPRDLNPTLTQQVDAAVCTALALRPVDRYRSVFDFSRALQGVTTGASSAAPPAARTAPSPAPPAQGPRTPAVVMETPLASAPRTPSPLSPTLGSRTPFPTSPLSPAHPSDAGLRSNHGFVASRSSGVPMTTPHGGGRSRVSDPRANRLLTPNDSGPILETHEQLLTGPRLLLAAIALLVIAVVTAGGVFLLNSAPPDRSSPSATVSGFFSALSSQDYGRAWQFMAASRDNSLQQDQFTRSQQADDARLGRVISATITQVDGANTSQAIVQVSVTRGPDDSVLSYSVTLTHFDGTTWLIASVGSS